MKLECRKCGHSWEPRTDKLPKRCPKCASANYMNSEPDKVEKVPSPEPQKEVKNPGVLDEIQHSVDGQNTLEQEKTPRRRFFARKKKEEPVEAPPVEEKERTRKRKEQLFSEKHPAAFGMFSSLAPRLHTMTLGLVFIYFALKEIIVGNYLFLLDWASKAPVLSIITDGIELYGPQEFIQRYWFLLVIMFSLVLGIAWVIHKVLWRFLFKDYYVEIVDKWGGTGLTLSRDGRLYWYTNNTWHRFWDAIYGSPERKTRKLYIKQRGKLFNIFNPPASLITVTIGEDEWLEARGVYGIIGHEKPVRHRIGRQEYTTLVTEFSTDPVPLEQSRTVFDHANDRLVAETRKLTHGNAALRLAQMQDGGFILSNDVREVVRNEARRKAEAAPGSDS